MSRLAAFALLTLAAFAWAPPFLDRAGTAALGLACLALAVGRVPGAARPSLFAPRPRRLDEAVPDFEPIMTELRERLAPYGAAGGSAADESR